MLFWILFIIILLFVKNPTKRGNLTPATNGILLFILFVTCFRFDVGYDYFAYYYTALGPEADIFTRHMEILNQAIFILCYKLFNWPPSVFIVYGIITLVPVFYILRKYSSNFRLSLLAYVAFFYLTDLGTIRQAVAITILLYAYKYLLNYNIWKYLICCIIAYFFHTSAICAIFIPLIYRYFNWKIAIVASIFIFLTFNLFFSSIAELLHYDNYIDRLADFKGGSLIMFANLLIFATLVFIVKKRRDITNYGLFYVVGMGCIIPFLIGGHMGSRLSAYYFVYICLLIPDVLKGYSSLVKRMGMVLLALFFTVNVYISTTNPAKSPFTPYKTIFEIDNYQNPGFKKIKVVRS